MHARVKSNVSHGNSGETSNFASSPAEYSMGPLTSTKARSFVEISVLLRLNMCTFSALFTVS